MFLRGRRLFVSTGVALAMGSAGCGVDDADAPRAETPTATVGPVAATSFPPAPSVLTGPIAPEVDAALDVIFSNPMGQIDRDALAVVAASGDARIAWLLADILRFNQSNEDSAAVVDAFTALSGTAVDDPFAWGRVTDLLIAWDLPAPPDYVTRKHGLFVRVIPGWQKLFDLAGPDSAATVDWRHVSWGGVGIDDRLMENVSSPCREGCIPALDDPAVTDALGGDWYGDDAIVFGIVVGGEARAYPKHIMEIHEMVNDTVGGRRVAVPYCTLCLSAQAYLTDDVAPGIETPDAVYELRTTGMLVRSNKVMYEFHTNSIFDTFTGRAVSGPLVDAGVQLEPVSVVTSSWGEWKRAHPATTIVAEDGGIGRSYPLDPLRGRDDDGPIFPIGNTDPRLAVQDRVVGVETVDGPIAFPVVSLRASATDAGQGDVVASAPGVEIVVDGGGFRAQTPAGDPVASHEAFWFAWSQFMPDTEIWTPAG